MDRTAYHPTPSRTFPRFALFLFLLGLVCAPLRAQDIFGEANKTPGSLTRVAVADF